MTTRICIKRTKPRKGGDEFPVKIGAFYQLVPPHLPKGAKRNKAEHAILVPDLDRVAYLGGKRGDYVRMGREGLRASLIRPDAVEIVTA
jgi:hypothetical protein